MVKKKKLLKIYAHGATNPIVIGKGEPSNEYVYIGATGGDLDYPVCFRRDHLDELIEFLNQVKKPDWRR